MQKIIKISIVALVLATALLATDCGAEENTETPVEETVSSSSATNVEGSNGQTCSCDNSDNPVCASNGVTYKNQCRFDCSKKRVKRLRVVKRGKCTGVTLNQYRGSQPSRPKQNTQSLDSIFANFFSS